MVITTHGLRQPPLPLGAAAPQDYLRSATKPLLKSNTTSSWPAFNRFAMGLPIIPKPINRFSF